MPLIEDEDPFWRVQLVNNTGEARRPFTSEAPRFDYQDHALPVGTDVTDTSLAGILGREREVCVPVTSGIISVNADDDDDDHDNSNNNASNSSSGSGSSDSSDNNRGWLGQALVLKLRQVNGDGVMSGVGGDIWCAALLLSAWLLENPEVVRGLDVLELGSGLGLCGITAGYLAKSVMLTDYVGELLVNLRHNVEVNRTPRVVSTVAPRKPIEHRRSRSGLKEDADHAPATGPHRGRPELQRCGRQRDGQRQQQQQQQQQQTSEPEHQQHLQIDDLREKTMAEITSRQRHHRVPDGDAPSDTVGRVGSPGRRDLERRGHKENSPVRISAAATANDAVVVSDGRDFLPPPPQATPLLPLSRADVRKLDWTTYAGDGEAGRASGGKEGGGGWWWDDRGPDTSQSGVMVPIGPQLPESDSLRCDVAIGSALVYSPHHACVADVMSHLFDEKGGCRAAYVVQLSTRPGFDDFLHRLGACGLHYRLQRISAVLPVAVLDEIRQTARGAAIGGPVTRTTDLAVALGADDDDSDCQDDSNDRNSDNDMGGQGEASGFDEFVLCSVFRSRDSTSRGEGAKSTR